VTYNYPGTIDKGTAAATRALLASDQARVRRCLDTFCLWARTSYLPTWDRDLPSPACILAKSNLQELVESANSAAIQYLNTVHDHELRIACLIQAQQRGDISEPLIIGPDGWLCDGMHRLASMYACNVPVVDVLDFSDGRSSLLQPPVSMTEVMAPRFCQGDGPVALREEFSKSRPYHHIFVAEVFNAGFAEALARELEELQWTLSTTEFYEQYEISLLDTDQLFESTAVDSLREIALNREFVTLIGTIADQGPLEVVDVSCHRMIAGQQIGIHNDFESGADVCRFTVHLNPGWTVADGGLFVTFSAEYSKAPTAVYLPTMNSAMLFEVSPTSFHAVTPVLASHPRYSIVISFRRSRTLSKNG
jgi:hypothetical protein